MRTAAILLSTCLALLLSACGSSNATAPGSPTAISVAPGATAGTAVVSFTAPTSVGTSPVTSYTVVASPGGPTATGTSSPITVTGLTPGATYTYGVVANSADGISAAATTGALRIYHVVETFREPMTQPNDTVFTGSFTFDTTSKAVSNLTGSLTQSMTKHANVYGPPMTTVALTHQLSSVTASPGGVDGLLVTTFALSTTHTLDPASGTTDPTGFAPGGTEYYGFGTGGANPMNAYAMIFVNTANPATVLVQAQLDKLAYADCTSGGVMMMHTCMTGTTVAGYGRPGTMNGQPVSQLVSDTPPVVPGAPTAVSVAPGATAGTAVVSFTAPASSGTSPVTDYTVFVTPGGIRANGTSSPITVTGLTPQTAYAYGVVARSRAGTSAAATTGALRFYSVVETFHEPVTQPNDTIFTGTFTLDTTSREVSNLAGSLTQSMTRQSGVYGPPMTTVTLANQLSEVAATLGGVDGWLVTTFALTSMHTLDPASGTTDPTGFAPGGTEYYGFGAGTPNPMNAYAMIFVNTADPTAALAQAQIDKLAYADCSPGGLMMMHTCMTGTTVAGYGRTGTMMGQPVSQVVTER
jgi:hypothetical protein